MGITRWRNLASIGIFFQCLIWKMDFRLIPFFSEKFLCIRLEHYSYPEIEKVRNTYQSLTPCTELYGSPLS
jgi:hypothetical protein